jgi:hypothetical protein
MLTNPQEIGGMTSSTEETDEYAKESLAWKSTFKAGKVNKIQVDHEEMIRQGAILMQEEQQEEVDLQIPQFTESVVAKAIKEELKTSKAADDESGIIATADDKPAQSCETVDTVNPAVEQLPVPQPEPEESGQVQVAKRKQVPKRRSSSQGSVATSRPRIRAPAKEKGASYMSLVSLAMSKLFATPARVALLSFLLLLWVLNMH